MIHPRTGAVRVASEVVEEAKAAARVRAAVNTGAKGTTKEKDPEAVPLTKHAFIVLR